MRRRYYFRGPKGYYHAYNRAVRRLKLFADDADRGYFLRLLGLAAVKHGVTVLAWCLVETHFHLALNAPGAAISRMMQTLQKTYAKYYNKKTGFTGSVFEGRFCSTWVRDLESLAYVVRYIHANSRDGGIMPLDYLWSSCRSYLGIAGRPPWFDPKPVLKQLGGIDGFVEYTKAAPPVKRRVREEDTAQVAFVAHIADRVRRRMEGFSEEDLDGLSADLATAWVAIHSFGARPRILAMALNWPSGRSLSTAVSRFDGLLRGRPGVRRALERC